MFTEELRYAGYDLTPDSLVIDVGAHKGSFAHRINELYHCPVLAFEPIHEFAEEARRLFKGNKDIELFEVGVGSRTQFDLWQINGDATGKFCAEGESRGVLLVALNHICEGYEGLRHKPADLIKLNCEGSEFDILEDVIENDALTIAKNWQVQFHKIVPQAEERYASIRSHFDLTHTATLDYPWTWQNFRIKA